MEELSRASELLVNAQQYRGEELEGKARVTARLAAAAALKALNDHKNLFALKGSSLEWIKAASTSPLLPADQQKRLEHFCLRVNEEYNLPGQIDLLADAQEFIQWVKNQINGAK